MDTETNETAGGAKILHMSKTAISWLKREIPKAIREVGVFRVCLGLVNWFFLILFLTAIYQLTGVVTTIGLYFVAILVFGLIEFFFVSTRELTHRPEYTPPQIDQEIISDTEKTINITGETDATVIVALAGETNIADYTNTHREIETGESVTFTKSEESVTIETPTDTETVNLEDTSVELFKHDFILFEYYEDVAPMKNHINYGDI